LQRARGVSFNGFQGIENQVIMLILALEQAVLGERQPYPKP